jgi:putative ABC transport system permease protein
MNPRLAILLLWRDWRSGELTLLLASLVIAVGTVTTITLFVDRLQRALLQESAAFLAADRVVSSSVPIDPAIIERATSIGLRQSETLSFLSMVFAEDRAQFASVKAVSAGYPLRGRLNVSGEAFVRGRDVFAGPEPGRVWLESRLFASLDIAMGDELEVGAGSFIVDQVLIAEPDRGGGFNAAGPRVMMHMSDVPKTRVVQPGSRLSYRYLFSGEDAGLDEFEKWVRPQLGEGMRLIGVREGAEGVGSALERAERFLLLGGLLGVLLAGVAIALSAHRYSKRHLDHVAILKTLGATPAGVDGIFIIIFVVLGVVATALGSGVGFAAQAGVVAVLSPFIPIELPAPGIRPVLIGSVTGFICLFAFALPPILKLRRTEPIRVIRRESGPTSLSDGITYLFGIGGSIGLMWWYSGDLMLTGMIVAGGTFALGLLSIFAFLMLRGGRVLGMQAGSAWRLALAGMQRRGQENTLQILVFGIAIMLLLILVLVRTALVDEWSQQIPDDAPNHFAINIAPDEVEPLRELFVTNAVDAQPLFPMIRGRITEVNGVGASDHNRALRAQRGEQPGPRPRAGGTRNLTFARALPDDNRIVAGQWWSETYAGPPLVSVESDLAESNGLNVGDTVVFKIQDRDLEATVASLRSVAWDNMQPNFFMILSPGSLDDFPSTYMTSFHLEPENKLFLNRMLKRYPTITVIEVDAIIAQIKAIIAQVSLAIELVLTLILLSGTLVLLSSIQASMDERFQQHAILRTLGASRKLIMGSLVIEFCALGLFAGLLATAGSEATVYGLETQIFDLEYTAHPWLWLLGPAVGVLLIGVIGTFATRRVVLTPPTAVLRDLA